LSELGFLCSPDLETRATQLFPVLHSTLLLICTAGVAASAGTLTAAGAYHFSAEVPTSAEKWYAPAAVSDAIAYVQDIIGVVPVIAAVTLLLALVSACTASGRERLAQAWVTANSWQQ